MGSFALIARSNDLHLKMRKKLHNGLRMKMCVNPTLLEIIGMFNIEQVSISRVAPRVRPYLEKLTCD